MIKLRKLLHRVSLNRGYAVYLFCLAVKDQIIYLSFEISRTLRTLLQCEGHKLVVFGIKIKKDSKKIPFFTQDTCAARTAVTIYLLLNCINVCHI